MPPRVLDVMTRQLAHLTRLVDDLLDIARVSRGRIELKREPLLLGDVIRQAIEANAQSLQTQRHALDLGEGAAALPLHGDRVRLTQVFSNVINNAAKYSDPEGRIAITTHVEGGDAVVRVSDSGVGIAPDMLTRVFDLFAQAPSALGLAKGGLGIGLTLARTLIELHGGRVSAESKGLGKGTTIVIRLPLDAAAGVQPSQSHRLAVARERPPSINVLVVDDNEDAANTTAQLLRESGSNVLVAYTGAAALELAERTDFDLALLDIGLPDMTGYALAEELRRFSGDRTHVLAVSGYGTREAARLANESGFDGYLVKPVSAKALETITRETAERSARREQVEHAAATQR